MAEMYMSNNIQTPMRDSVDVLTVVSTANDVCLNKSGLIDGIEMHKKKLNRVPTNYDVAKNKIKQTNPTVKFGGKDISRCKEYMCEDNDTMDDASFDSEYKEKLSNSDSSDNNDVDANEDENYHDNDVYEKVQEQRKRKIKDNNSEIAKKQFKSETIVALPSLSEDTKVVDKIVKPKVRDRYRKRKIEPVMEVDSDDSNTNTNNMLVIDDIDRAMAKSFVDNQYNTMTNYHYETINGRYDHRFVSHMLNNNYYMFIVETVMDEAKTIYLPKVSYVANVPSVQAYYIQYYKHVDDHVMIVTFEKYRFMIPQKEILKMQLDIPDCEKFADADKSAAAATAANLSSSRNTKKIYFNEVKDIEFLNKLTKTFMLDIYFSRIKITMILASMGEWRSKIIAHHVFRNMTDGSLFSMPLNFSMNDSMMIRDSACDDSTLVRMQQSQYLADIIKYSEDKRFIKYQGREKREDRLMAARKKLEFWYKNRIEDKDKNSYYFTYKYGSVARIFFKLNTKDTKRFCSIKRNKTNDVSDLVLIENYLDVCAQKPDCDNFILVVNKKDERISIIKNGDTFFWITSILSEIIIGDVLDKYKLMKHHVFKLNIRNRKDINIKHNGIIMLVSMYTSGYLDLEGIIDIGINNFRCEYFKKNFK
uniref:Ie-1 n=1 Tax=Malacosoma sp. alphabaculovirus TaxID=1881632 RepID=A0A1B1V5N2_9ABAC|nr:ie-1 [Malacosoma sp. alphabaculovirus]